MSNNKAEMTFWDHLEVLRWVILRVGIALVVAFCVCFAFMPKMFDKIITAPTKGDFFMYKALGGLFDGDFNVDLININVTAPFFTHMSTSLWVAVILIFPYVLWEIWRFVAPALYPSEKKGVRSTFVGAGGLFYLGCALGYFVIFPITFRFLAGYHIGEGILTQISLNSYISTFLSIIFVMGLVFELPILAYLLSSLGILHKPILKQYRRYAIVILLILAALITPTGDPFTLGVVFLPIYLLYEVSILIVKP